MKFINVIFFLHQFSHSLIPVFNVETIIREGGLFIIFIAVFAQTGLFFSFFLPSGIFLFTGGIFLATGQLQHNLFIACTCLVFACVLGCCTGYWFGRKTGTLLYKRKDSRFFRQKHLRAANKFYKKYGQFALTLGILFPIIRTFAPIVAGIVKMDFARFLFLVFIGSLLWVPPFVLAGYLIGSIPQLKEYFPYIITAFLLLVTTPVIIRIIKELKKSGDENEDE
jgi:membrane-associated protein